MSKHKRHEVQRRDFLSTSVSVVAGGVVAAAFPAELSAESLQRPAPGSAEECGREKIKPSEILTGGKLRVFAGRTPPGEGWHTWSGGGTQICVDLTGLNLRGFPIIIAGLGGRTVISQTTGGDCVLPLPTTPGNRPDATGFRICVSWAAPAISPTYVSANQFHGGSLEESLKDKDGNYVKDKDGNYKSAAPYNYGWYINWIAISE